MNLLAYTVMVIFAISGNSSLLALVSVVMIVTFAFLYASRRAHLSMSRSTIVFGFAALFVLTALSASMPQPNMIRFFMSVFFLLGNVLLWSYIIGKPTHERAFFFEILLRIYIIGALIQISGVMGHQMETFKAIVQQPLLSNLERESFFAILGTRFFGIFSEPSYFAVHYSVVCAALYLSRAAKRALIYFLIGFTLCPSPNFLFGAIVLLYTERKKIVVSPHHTIGALALTAAFVVLQADRLGGFIDDVDLFLSGGYTLSSFSQRLIMPTLDFIALVRQGQLPLPYSCIDDGTCPLSLVRIPLFTFWAFFTVSGLICYLLLAWKLTGKGLITVAFFMLLSAIFSGGSGFLPHFSLLFISSIFISGFEANQQSRKAFKAPRTPIKTPPTSHS